MVWSTNQQKPYLSGTGVHNIKQTFAGIYIGKKFEPYKPKTRKCGTGDARQVNGRLREGSPLSPFPRLQAEKVQRLCQDGRRM